ncbi:MAG: polyphosphate polymerase domain-containing protein, partial [Oscillospiraceae bacterium]|nr:polyphosphate polymerase domain-containing protein [Oscillospiraceae bacterium]
TPEYLLIRRSIEHPVYKEKLRVRSYGKVEDDTTVFVELKKKYDGVVYKRRIDMPYKSVREYLCEGKLNIPKTQITNEIDYVLSFYGNINPSMYISYERAAYYSKTDSDFRITFDKNILWRDYDLTLKSEVYGKPLLSDDEMVLEVKTSLAMPLWLTQFLSKNKIYKASFSKYGNAYKTKVLKGDLMNVG